MRGYHGNRSWVQVGARDSSPITFLLDNTGGNVSIAVQSSGSAGDYPSSQSPTTGVKLPLSTSGGFGTSTQTGIALTGTNGALVKKSGTAALTTTNLSGDSSTTNSAVVTVTGIQTIPVANATPYTSDTFRYGDNKWDVVTGHPRFVQIIASGTGGPQTLGHGDCPRNSRNNRAVRSNRHRVGGDCLRFGSFSLPECTRGHLARL
jgi:hypothetical protein